MKKVVIIILLCGITILGLTGCSNSTTKEDSDMHSFLGTIIECEQEYMIVTPDESEDEYKSSDKFKIDYVNDFNYCNVGNKVKITYKGMINESYPAKIGTTNIELNDYYTLDNRTIYLASNLKEFYIKDEDKNITLKTYLSTTFQTLDDGIKNITDKLELKDTLKDGGTRIYKSKDKDITMIVCNTTKNDKNILIGDYSIEYKEDYCKN